LRHEWQDGFGEPHYERGVAVAKIPETFASNAIWYDP